MAGDMEKRLAALEQRNAPQPAETRLSPRREEMLGDMHTLPLGAWSAKYAQELSGSRYSIALAIPGYPATTRLFNDLADRLPLEVLDA
jgi:hypothetical protein